MNLSLCTLTGVDAETDIIRLVNLSSEFPMVEWGLLYSPKEQGSPGRYPSTRILKFLLNGLPIEINLALHVCGKGVHDLLYGEPVVTDMVKLMNARGGRVQLNFNHSRTPINFQLLDLLFVKFPRVQFITQQNPGNSMVAAFTSRRDNHAVLFDASGGRGLLPSGEWLAPLDGIKCGYAGGLGPDSIKDQLELITEAAGNHQVWIDMESKLRTTDEEGLDRFDLTLCRETLVAVDEFMVESAINSYVRDELTLSQAASQAYMGIEAFMDLLGSKSIPVVKYPAAELEVEVKAFLKPHP